MKRDLDLKWTEFCRFQIEGATSFILVSTRVEPTWVCNVDEVVSTVADEFI